MDENFLLLPFPNFFPKNIKLKTKKRKLTKKTLWSLFMDGVQLPQGWSHFMEAVYF